MLLIHKDIPHMPITELENKSESVWVKVFANKTAHFVASWYRPPHSDENLTPLEDLQKFDTLFREQLNKSRDINIKEITPSPLSSCSRGFQLWRYCLAGQTQ